LRRAKWRIPYRLKVFRFCFIMVISQHDLRVALAYLGLSLILGFQVLLAAYLAFA